MESLRIRFRKSREIKKKVQRDGNNRGYSLNYNGERVSFTFREYGGGLVVDRFKQDRLGYSKIPVRQFDSGEERRAVKCCYKEIRRYFLREN